MCEIQYRTVFGQDAENQLFCPCRIAPLGAHIDHQFGIVTGMAIDRGVSIAYAPGPDGWVHVNSVDFSGADVIRIPLQDAARGQKNAWETHVRAAVRIMFEQYGIGRGMSCVIKGDLPIGGLSSSAAVILCCMSALADVNGITETKEELMRLAQKAENEYVGVACGKLDYACEMLSSRDHLLVLDCLDDRHKAITRAERMKGFRIVLAFSGLTRSLVSSDYNSRRTDCQNAAEALLGFAGAPWEKEREPALRDVPFSTYERFGDRLKETERKRAEHFYSEMRRVNEGISAWERGDLDHFGKLMFASGESSIVNYECATHEMVALYRILTETDGVYGARFSGAGFRGYCVALVDPAKEEQMMCEVKNRYLKRYPHLAEAFALYSCSSCDGMVLA